MAAAGFYLLSSLAIVLFACQTCQSTECNDQTVWDCERGQIVNDCPKYRHIAGCLSNLDRCEDDSLQVFVDNSIENYNLSINHCPGLEDGTCYFTRVHNCTDYVPYYVVYRENWTGSEKQAACDEFKGKSELSKQCLEDIRPLCSSDSPQQKDISSSIKTVEKIEKKCGY